MKRKITTLLLAAAIVLTFVFPTAFAAQADCSNVLNELDIENFNSEILDSSNCGTNDILNTTMNTEELKTALENQLNIQVDENCSAEDILNAVESNCDFTTGCDISQLSPETLEELLNCIQSDDVECTNSTCTTTEVATEDTDSESDETSISTPTVDATPDADLIPTESDSYATPIPTESESAEATPIATSVAATEETPEPTEDTTDETTPAPTATEEPAATSTPSDDVTGISDIEKQMVELVNADRAEAGLSPLTIDAELTTYARTHSQDMSSNNFFSHTSPTNGSFSERLRNSGLSVRSAGENIAMYGSVEKAQAALMASDGHRANILGNYTHVGIGIVYNESKGAYYITQWFATK